jgi:hypothetical protein
LQVVPESQASGRTAEVFGEAKAALGIQYVPLPFQAFAAYPKFIDVQWQLFKPLFGTREFFELAARLQAEAYTYIHNYFEVRAIHDGLTVAEAARVTDTFWGVEPALLLMLTVQMQALDGPVGKAEAGHPANRVVDSGTPEFANVEEVGPAIRRVLDEARHTAELPYCSEELRAFAQWPELLFALWRGLKPAMQSIFHEQAVLRMRESAWTCAQEIPLQIEMEYSRMTEHGMTSEEIATVTHLTELLVRGSAVSVLNIAFAKIALEGGNRTEVRESSEPEERVA